ncbi:hypothetical protein G6F56_013156 [Rhizopus delemar]|nr:hypothetical protein G6F56_013156 [Rhizopus delemar]
MRQRLHHDQRQHGQDDHHDHEGAEQRDHAGDLTQLGLAQVTQRTAVAAGRDEENREVLHGAGEHHAGQDPQHARQITHLRGQHRADTGRAAGLAVAALHQFARALYQLGLALPQRLAEADATGEVVVQVNSGHELLQQLDNARVALAATQLATAALVGDREPGTIAVADRLLQVARIGHHRHGGDDVQRVGRAKEAIQRILLAGKRAQQQRLRQLPPHRGGMQLL